MVDGEGIRRLKLFIDESGSLELAAKRLDVWPSTLRKVIAGSKISLPTRSKLVSIIGKCVADERQSTHKFDSLIAVIKQTISNPIDILEASSRFGVNPSTIKKILEGKPLSYNVQEKLIAAAESQLATDAAAREPSKLPSMVERLKHVHQLYEDLGTLEAAGRVIGVTRERVRQLLVKGSRLGLFEYKPFEYPFVPKEKLIADYRRLLSLGRVAKANGITSGYLGKLLTAYRITDSTLRSLWTEGQKIRCINSYVTIKNQLGYHPTTTVLQAKRPWRYLSMKITRLWGSFDAFRHELAIPAPRRGSPSFSEDTRKWRETRQRLALIVRMQHLDRIRECLGPSKLQSANEIAYECGLGLPRTLFLVKLLMATGEVIREGQSSTTRYRLVSDRGE